MMADKVDINVDVASLATVDAAVLSALRVGQRLLLTRREGQEVPEFCTEAGITLAPLSETQLAARCAHAKVIIRAIKREAGTGAIQQLQVRVYPSGDAGSGAPGALAGPGAAAAGGATAARAAAGGDANTTGALDQEFEYKLRREQYQALADNPELVSMLADPRLQAALSGVEGAADREQALTAQLENQEFQGFVSQVLRCLDPERVPATAATAAAVAMASH